MPHHPVMLRFALRSVLKATPGCSARCSREASPDGRCNVNLDLFWVYVPLRRSASSETSVRLGEALRSSRCVALATAS